MSTRKCYWCGKNIYDGERYYSGGLTRIYCCKRCQVKGEEQRQKEIEIHNKEIEDAGGYWPWIKMHFLKALPKIILVLFFLFCFCVCEAC